MVAILYLLLSAIVCTLDAASLVRYTAEKNDDLEGRIVNSSSSTVSCVMLCAKVIARPVDDAVKGVGGIPFCS